VKAAFHLQEPRTPIQLPSCLSLTFSSWPWGEGTCDLSRNHSVKYLGSVLSFCPDPKERWKSQKA
jgi:hypothetical protein